MRLGARSTQRLTNQLRLALEPECLVLSQPIALIKTLPVSSKRAREIYGYGLVLVRPDLHVAWRGNQLPRNAHEIAAVALGHASPND